MTQKKVKRNPVITIRLLREERERLEASIPKGRKLSAVGRERLEAMPDPDQWSEEEARFPLELLAREEFQATSAENRAIWLRQSLFPDYQPAEHNEFAPTGERLTGKRGRKSASYRVEGGRTVDVTRDQKVKVVVSQELYDRLLLVAEALGLTLNSYCRRVLMDEPVFAFDISMGVNSVVKHAEGALAVKQNGLDAELEKAAERLVAAEAEKIVRAAAREQRKAQQEAQVEA